jgi:hypothetical protein
MDRYLAGAYWGARKETVESCAARAARFLGDIEPLWPTLSGWRWSGRGFAAKEVITSSSIDTLIFMFNKGRNRFDTTRMVIEDLGYSTSVWNKRSDPDSASLYIACGTYSKVRGLGNAAALNLPQDFPLDDRDRLVSLASAFVSAWEPDRFIVTSQTRNGVEYDRARTSKTDWQPFLDVALYLKDGLPYTRPEAFDFTCRMGEGTLWYAKPARDEYDSSASSHTDRHP